MPSSRAYFDTPARAERLQLLQHLVRNAGEVIYLRAPAGAGKTLFGHRLLDTLGTDLASVWVRGGVDADIPAVVADQLGMQADEVANWPAGVLRGLGSRDLLVVVDDADQLALPGVERLAALHAQGGRLLLLGHGGLAQTTREWDVQFVDLPPFTVEQSAAFLHSNAGDESAHINEDLAGFLHHSAHGRPGLLLDSLDEVLARARRQAETRDRSSGTRKIWPWLAGAAAALLLSTVLVYQDQINALFEPTVDAQPVEQQDGPAPTLADAAPPAVPATTRTDAADQTAPADASSADAVPVGAAQERIPEIALPELSALPASAANTESAATDQTDAADGGETDPLAAVMRDALTAAEEEAGPLPTAIEQQTASPVEQTADPVGGPTVASVTDQAQRAPDAVAAQVASEPPVPVAAPAPKPAENQAALPARPDPQAKPTGPKTVAETADATVRQAAAVVEDRVVSPPAPPAPPATASPAQPAPAAPRVDGSPAAAPVEERSANTPAPPTRTSPPKLPAGPAPVEERTATVDEPVVGKPAVVRGATELDVLKRVYTPPATGGPAWLKSRKPQRYTLQLVGARDRAAVEKFVRVHKVAPPYAVFERSLSGRPWYSLVAGDYPDRDAAVAARERLPTSLAASDIWPRTFASVQESLK